MDIPTRQFELRRQPNSSQYYLVCVAIFVLSAALSLLLFSRIMAGKLMVFFPFVAISVMIVGIRWLHAPCILSVNSTGFSLEVKRGSIHLPVSTRSWTWDELLSYEFFSYRGTMLTLEVEGDSLVFKWGALYQLYGMLRKYFPEQEKKSD